MYLAFPSEAIIACGYDMKLTSKSWVPTKFDWQP